MIKVGFNGSCLAGGALRGWSRYTHSLIESIREHHADIEVEVFSRETAPKPGRNHTLWEQWALPRQLRQNKIAVFHGPANGGVPALATCPTVLTVHDLFGEEASRTVRSIEKLRRLKSTLRYKVDWWVSLSKAKRIITISEFCRNDLVRYGVDPKKIRVIYEAADPVFSKTPVDSSRFKGTPYLLYVGGFEERKNVAALLKAFSDSDLKLKLKLVGKLDRWGEQLKQGFAHDSRIEFLGFVPDTELAQGYSGATAFVTLSKGEGFGLPLVEAMACGCPIVTSVGGALAEIAGEAGLIVDSASLVERVGALISQPEQLAAARRQATERAKQFSWKKTAAETVAVYREVIA